MTFWSNFIGYQLVWFVAVIYAGENRTWPGVVAGVVFVSWQLLASEHLKADARLLILAIVLGCLIDGVLASGGWAKYAAPEPALPAHGAPLWILAVWASFSQTLTRSLSYLRTRPWLAALFGAIGGPLAYLSAQRGWDAVVFQAPVWRGLMWLSCTWAIAMFMLAGLSHSRASIRSLS